MKIFHYSSDPKPWARLLDPFYATFSEEAMKGRAQHVSLAGWVEQEWLKDVLVKFNGYRAWVLKELLG